MPRGIVVSNQINVDENEETSQEAGVQAMPTFQVYKNRAKVRLGGGIVFEFAIICKSLVNHPGVRAGGWVGVVVLPCVRHSLWR